MENKIVLYLLGEKGYITLQNIFFEMKKNLILKDIKWQ